ncbi:hypothetical protein GCM10009809_27680 [Isoptericola hypogeus]|uniref:Copper(I)-binding protein n=1 Tax=Isoptericola hypogeus TaxID=300179 RepID=A0ABN2JKS8_9MICO
MSRSARPARTVVVAASAAAGALLLAACSPTTTTLPYAASDGARVNLTDSVRGLNLMVVTEGEGMPGAILGALANDSAETVDFELAPAGAAPLSVSVPAGQTIYLSAQQDGDQVLDATIDAVATIPGTNLEATLSGAGADEDFFLPVFDGSLPEYADYLPEASAPAS